jgi:hypothetical protein
VFFRTVGIDLPSSALKIEAAGSSETSITFRQSTLCLFAEDIVTADTSDFAPSVFEFAPFHMSGCCPASTTARTLRELEIIRYKNINKVSIYAQSFK